MGSAAWKWAAMRLCDAAQRGLSGLLLAAKPVGMAIFLSGDSRKRGRKISVARVFLDECRAWLAAGLMRMA
jgi:hypothetical protein